MILFGAGFFSESMAVDITVFGTIIGGFSAVIGLLWTMRKNRGKEIESAVMKVINASPEKIVVNPQPLVVEMKKQFVTHEEWVRLDRRIRALEDDKQNILDRIEAVPAKTIALLKDTKGLL